MAFRFNPTTSQLDWVNPKTNAIDIATKLQITRIATEAIMEGDCVKADSSTHVSLATNDLNVGGATVLGIAANDANIGDAVNITLFGAISNAAFSVFALHDPLFLDIDGGITNINPMLPGAFFRTEIGKSLGGSDIFVNIQPPIVL